MIAYVRGRLDGAPDAREVPIRAEHGTVLARTFGPPGGLAQGDAVIAASATISVGIADHDETALLGPWAADRPDPSGPLGLASTPVILLADHSTSDVALAGVARSGRGAAVTQLDGLASALGLALLATISGAEVVLLTDARGHHVDLVRILGGRAVVALPGSDPAVIRAWLADAAFGADIPVPTTEEGTLATIASMGLETTHQLVQVDPAPALDEAGVSVRDATFPHLTAAAAGVLAGRIAAENRRWRAAVDP